MEKKTEIKSIKITVDGKEIEMSLESAQKLYNILGNIFEKKTVFVDMPGPYVPIPYPLPVPKLSPGWDWRMTPICGDDAVYCEVIT